MLRFLFCISLLALFISNSSLFAQGCSDAGICTLDGIGPAVKEGDRPSKNELKFGLSLGAADENVQAFTGILDYQRSFDDSWSANIKIGAANHKSKEVSVSGLSDALFSLQYAINSSFRLMAGVKLPLNRANEKNNGTALPMVYQTSLGTTDMLLGVSYQLSRLQLSLAYQQALDQNENSYYGSINVPPAPDEYRYKRKADLVIRLSYPFNLKNQWTLVPGILPIYHLDNDEYTIAGQANSISIQGSEGLTLNATLLLSYAINKKSDIQLLAGAPLIVRDERPDGLTRSMVAGLQYAYHF